MADTAQTNTFQPAAAPKAAPVSGILQRQCACGSHTTAGEECEDCKKKREAGSLQRAALSGPTPPGFAPPVVHDVLRSSGQPLDPAARAMMEPRFGQDFSQVRVHTDTQAAHSAQAVSALAYTVGRDLVFGQGQYAPHNPAGRELIAHELTHVVQQARSGRSAPAETLQVGQENDPAEREAELNARMVTAEQPAQIPAPSRLAPTLQRQGTGVTPGTYCKLEICWAPIRAYNLSKAAQVHGVINITKGATTHHVEVDPSQHMPAGIWHSHVVDNPGSKTSPDCQTISATCAEAAKIESAASTYESKDIIYDPLTVTGPNSNSFVEWTLNNAGINTSLVNVPFGATGWSYYQSNPVQRTDPPHVARTDPGKTPAAAPKSTAGGACSIAYTKQTSATGYLNLIRAAETKMTAAGITDIKEQIKILRGLYYGTPWSRDFGAEHSLGRVAGFQTYTVSGVKYPRDPVSILDCGLYTAIQQSQDVTTHGATVDVGHLLIGLDAREATVAGISTPNFYFPGFGGTGLEIVTWLGDLGGGAGSLARDRVLRSATQPVSAKFSGVDYGGSSNLEGDIAAYIVASGGKTSVAAPAIPTGKGIADQLEAYLSPATTGGSTDWKSRAKTFLTMTGGTFNAAGALSNEATMIDNFASQIESFACAYITQRFMGTVSETQFLAMTDNVRPCSKEVAEAFVHALEDAMSGGGRIEAKRFPTPLPADPGACFSVTAPIRARQKAKQLYQQAEDLWKAL